MGNPYQGGSSLAQFPFASRGAAPNAPLFYSAHDKSREDEDEEEHEREVADFYALQRSRRHLGTSRLEESSEAEDDTSRSSGLEGSHDGRAYDGRGIRSSWRGDRPKRGNETQGLGSQDRRSPSGWKQHGSQSSYRSDLSTANLHDVGLDNELRDEPPDDLAVEIPADEDQPSLQQLRSTPREMRPPVLPPKTSPSESNQHPLPQESDSSRAPPAISHPAQLPPRHDAFWGTLYFICLASLFASFALVWLHTSSPSRKRPLGDTIYTTLHASYHLLAIDTLVAAVVSLLWLALLRSFVRPLVYAILVAVPVILFSFFLYPLISSFKGAYHGHSIQDNVLRGFSFIPGVLAVLWTFALFKGRRSLGKAISILEFCCRILAANPGLLVLGFGSLVGVVLWTWLWVGMFTRVFLGGHLAAGAMLYVIDATTWWLGLFFVVVYLWTLGIMSGIQRATTAATVSQWYFHRLEIPAPTSREVVDAAFTHASSTLFGTISLASLLALLIRVPYLVLPRRLLAFAGLCSYTVFPSTIATLTNPLTLTYSAIYSQPLLTASQALSRLSFLASPSKHPQAVPFHARNTPSQAPLHSYTLSLLLLRSTRFITSLALGFGGWVSTARSVSLASPGGGATIKGSLYGYVVGMIAAAIGWAVLGAIDGVVVGVVDAVVVCWGSEVGRGGDVRYCQEAWWLFSEDERTRDEESRGFLRDDGG